MHVGLHRFRIMTGIGCTPCEFFLPDQLNNPRIYTFKQLNSCRIYTLHINNLHPPPTSQHFTSCPHNLDDRLNWGSFRHHLENMNLFGYLNNISWPMRRGDFWEELINLDGSTFYRCLSRVLEMCDTHYFFALLWTILVVFISQIKVSFSSDNTF